MRPLAEFIMRGRTQALAVIVISVLSGVLPVSFYWLGSAAMGLVFLRRGSQEGLFLLAWALLPAAVLWFQFGEIMPLTVLLGTALATALLRWSQSWQTVLIAATVTGLLTSTLLLVLADEYLATLVAAYGDIVTVLKEEFAKQSSDNAIFAEIEINSTFIAGVFGVIQTLATVLSVVIARWWQSMLYNPGGFQQEFHQLRLQKNLVLLLAVSFFLLSYSGTSYSLWASILVVPFLVAGIALVHGLVGIRKIGTNWLVTFYILLLLLDQMKIFIAILALFDSWLDFRTKLMRASGSQPKDEE